MSTTIDALRRRRRSLPTHQPERATDAQAELALLREENRRLKAQWDRPPDLTTLMGRVRHTRSAASNGHDPVDEAAGLLAEDLVLREGLLEICRELLRFLTDLEDRLAQGSTGA